MRFRGFCSGLIGIAAVIPAAAIAETDKPAQHSERASSFILASPSAAPPRVRSLLPAAANLRIDAAMPRDLPEVAVDDARPVPTPGLDWHPRSGTVVRLRPAKLRLKMGF